MVDECVEVFGAGEWNDYDVCLKRLCSVLELDYGDIEHYTVRKNGLLVKLVNDRAVNEWERKSREKRIRLSHLIEENIHESDTKIKVFAAAPTKYKLLLHMVRKSLSDFKYIWIGKRGVMARHRSRSQIHVIKCDDDINYVRDMYKVTDKSH
ncbi:few polyhedra [Phthorimaea operculella granulovirus]|uniref:Few polyhedra n=1 Tax=Phthorimaea operculella granulovirus TaxID=192584 RepID=Q8JRU9_9BBAC|nr:few polyhedra [Phthorimaea operculella granulovirus]AAM70308.1 few polyhedra [Phthorimaea operculella granulovirus]ANY57499.1 few polyhedra [Phthorimaea operculella granulovirus]QBH65945.1 few polyhedra [Phthorimaea operculella granulovirus]QBH66075.1 few polyhedra [Phthorimaea operculella granulovirus]QBH66205.1 few polyhedra [Phthorimaea operculella granulovirus]